MDIQNKQRTNPTLIYFKEEKEGNKGNGIITLILYFVSGPINPWSHFYPTYNRSPNMKIKPTQLWRSSCSSRNHCYSLYTLDMYISESQWLLEAPTLGLVCRLCHISSPSSLGRPAFHLPVPTASLIHHHTGRSGWRPLLRSRSQVVHFLYSWTPWLDSYVVAAKEKEPKR